MLVLGSKDYIDKYIRLIAKHKRILKNEFGKPYIENSNIFFNKSNSKEISVLVFDSIECGVDIENIKKYDLIMAKKFCSDFELEFLKTTKNKDYYFTLFWVLKEAYLKCIGTGINMRMNNISFIKNNKLILKLGGYTFKTVDFNGHLIAICKEVK